MSAFTKCFRPVSNYPTDFADLAVWLRADSGVTFNIPTKRVSAWQDKSGNSNDVAQATVSKQPLREGYGGQNEKAYFSFDGENDGLISDSNSPIGSDFTIFEVSKFDSVSGAVFNYSHLENKISIGIDSNGYFFTRVDGDGVELTTNTGITNTGKNHIGVLKKHNKRIDLSYYDSSNSITNTTNNPGFDGSVVYNESSFSVGVLDGQSQELIVYNRVLSDTEIAKVTDYLNLKYKIY
tara:strand:- start:526 stop:1236 length:711 start_codon:yes stop_codon:yes gene_type:complete